jgi:hypothetical protein
VTWLRTRITRLRTALATLASLLAPDAISLGKLGLCIAWCWLLFGGVAYAIQGQWFPASYCWGTFCGAALFVRWRPATEDAVAREIAKLRAAIEAAAQEER